MSNKVVSVLALMLALTTGCVPAGSNSSRDTPSVKEQYPAEQSWALTDGIVTEQEYHKAIDGFTNCVRNAGFKVTDPVISPIDGLTLLYDLMPEGDRDTWGKMMEACNVLNISHIEPTYVAARDQVMDEELRTATSRCLRERGHSLSGSERNVGDFQRATSGSGAVMECVLIKLKELFPNAPGFLKIRW